MKITFPPLFSILSIASLLKELAEISKALSKFPFDNILTGKLIFLIKPKSNLNQN